MTYILPRDLCEQITDAGEAKVKMSISETLIRSYMAGAILAIAAAFAITITVNTGQPLVGAILFPVGFILLSLMGFDLLTGVFTLTPLAYLDRRPGVGLSGIARNWALTFIGNFSGAITVALMFATISTMSFTMEANAVGNRIGLIGIERTLGYAEHGSAGMFTLFLRGVLCNWMVSTAIIAGFASTNVTGKVVVMWMPIMIFFYMGFEHSVVNMFLFPAGLMLNGGFSIMDYLIWNEIPTIIGNLVGGLTFVGLPIYFAHKNSKKLSSTVG